MSEVERYEAPSAVMPGSRLIAWAQAADAAYTLAKRLTTTDFVPKTYKGKPDEAAAAILLGDELGLAPLAALRSVYVLQGTPAMYARAMVALVVGRGHRIWTEAETATSVTVAGYRAGYPEQVERSTWDLDRAKREGFAQRNANYRDHPAAMLYARAASDVARRVAPDVLLGIPETAEDLGAPLSGLDDTPGGSGTRTVQRRTNPTTSAPVLPQRMAVSPPPVTSPQTDEPQTDEPDDDPPPPVTAPQMTGPQRARIHSEFKARGMSREDYLGWVAGFLGRDDITTTNEVTPGEASRIIDHIEECAARGVDFLTGELPDDDTDARLPYSD